MTGTVEKEFEVAEKTDDYLWLEVKHGKNKGIQIAVPLEGYDEELQNLVEELSEGQVIEAELQSTNQKNTAWKLTGLPEQNRAEKSNGQQSAAFGD